MTMVLLLTCGSLCKIRRTRTINVTSDRVDTSSLNENGTINPKVMREMTQKRLSNKRYVKLQEKINLRFHYILFFIRPPIVCKEPDPSINDENNSNINHCTDLVTKQDNSYTNVQMSANDQQMTISNFTANNHVNLVKVKKIDTDNMISLDIISANCYNGRFFC